MARRLDPLLAHAACTGRRDCALRPARAVDHGAFSVQGRPARRSLAPPFPHRAPTRAVRGRRRRPEQLRALLRTRAHTRLLEPHDHRRARPRRPSRPLRGREAVRLRRLDPRRDRPPIPAAAPVAPRPRRTAPARPRLARPGRAARIRPHVPGYARARALPSQRADRRRVRGETDRSTDRPERDQRRLPDLHAPAGDVLRRRRDRPLPATGAPRHARGHRGFPRDRLDGAAADRLPPPARERRLRRPRGSDRAPPVRARRLHRRPDGRRRRRPRRLLTRAHVQRNDADAQPGVLQPAVAVDSNCDRARQSRAELRARRRSLSGWCLGHPVGDIARQHRGDDGAPHRLSPEDGPRRRRTDRRCLRANSVCLGGRGRNRVRSLVLARRRRRSLARRADRLGRRGDRGGHRRLSRPLSRADDPGAGRAAVAAAPIRYNGVMPELDRIRNFSIVAHIDHGKSTLADRILELTETLSEREMREQVLDTMELERERGITIKAQAVRVTWRGHQLNLIDTPGHVDFTYEVSRSLQACEGALLVVDAAQGVEAQTVANAYLAIENDLEIVPVVNKIDLPQADPDGAAAESAELVGERPERVLRISAKTGEGVEPVLDALVERIPAPAGDPAAPARALIFDSSYDQYRGVVAFVRVVDGEFHARERLRAMATGTRFEAQEIGFMSPTMRPVETLSAGEVGYVITGLKDVSRLRVGDTLTSEARPAAEPLPGYKAVKPMVFAGLFPTDSDQYPDLRDALEKLKLNDAALFYEPETSQALGFGS